METIQSQSQQRSLMQKQFNDYLLMDKELIAEGTYLFKLLPLSSTAVVPFTSGQYCKLRNPQYSKPEEEHYFSIASSPTQQDALEFCIKVYGNWTQALTTLDVGDRLEVSMPQGKFVWDESVTDAVFLVGGIGISPMMSMMRQIHDTEADVQMTLIYGNRYLEAAAFLPELEKISQKNNLHIVHVLSELDEDNLWQGHRGFITDDVVKKEVDLSKEPTFFFCGPPIFIKLMNEMLEQLGVPEKRRRYEQL